MLSPQLGLPQSLLYIPVALNSFIIINPVSYSCYMLNVLDNYTLLLNRILFTLYSHVLTIKLRGSQHLLNCLFLSPYQFEEVENIVSSSSGSWCLWRGLAQRWPKWTISKVLRLLWQSPVELAPYAEMTNTGPVCATGYTREQPRCTSVFSGTLKDL